jgi:hypothetical protein
MPSPFPGMDPYIEDQGRWADFHSSLVTYCRDTLAARLPEDYVAQIGERVYLVTWQVDESRAILPDVAVLREDRPAREAAGERPGVATLEPVVIPYANAQEQVRETWVDVLRLPDERLVTIIEVLSPTNKAGSGRWEYLGKRRDVFEQPVHLVEIDLLVAGARVPMARPLPRGDYYAIVARAGRRPDCEVYAWSMRDRLPTIPVPLLAPDPDVPLDLAELVAPAYEHGRYARRLRYERPLTLPLRAEDRAWAEGLAQAAVRR